MGSENNTPTNNDNSQLEDNTSLAMLDLQNTIKKMEKDRCELMAEFDEREEKRLIMETLEEVVLAYKRREQEADDNEGVEEGQEDNEERNEDERAENNNDVDELDDGKNSDNDEAAVVEHSDKENDVRVCGYCEEDVGVNDLAYSDGAGNEQNGMEENDD